MLPAMPVCDLPVVEILCRIQSIVVVTSPMGLQAPAIPDCYVPLEILDQLDLLCFHVLHGFSNTTGPHPSAKCW